MNGSEVGDAPFSDLKVMEDVFNSSQHVNDWKKKIKRLTKLFNRTEYQEFLEHFLGYLKLCLACQENAPVVDRTLQFVAKFAVSMSESVENENDENSTNCKEFGVQFLNDIWTFILNNHQASNAFVRLHLCQFVSKLFNEMSDEANLEVDTYKLIQKAMLRLSRDKSSLVRVQAVWALSRLQDASEKDCPAIKALIFHLENDPCGDVRQAIVEMIGIASVTLTPLISRIRDVKEGIRRAAYETLAKKIHVKLLSIAQRIDILKQGLNDRSEKVRKACTTTLLPSWYEQCNNSILTFLKHLDVVDATEITKAAFDVLISKQTPDDAIADFNILDENRIVNREVLSPETMFYWHMLCDYVMNYHEVRERISLDKILPEFFLFYDFIMKLSEDFKEGEDTIEHIDNIFICHQLILMSLIYDYVDEDERRRGVVFVKLLLLSPFFNENIIGAVIKLLEKVMPNQKNRINFVLEIIGEIRENVSEVEVPMDPEQMRQINLKIAQLKIELNICRDEMEACVKNHEFEKAQEKKEKIESLEKKLSESKEALQPKMKEVSQEKDDPLTLQKCLLIFCVIMEDKSFNLPRPNCLSLVDVLVLPSIEKVDNCVRELAIKSLGLSCITHVELASQHLFFLLEVIQVDTSEKVRITAIKAVFDIILYHGFNIFSSEKNEPNSDLHSKSESELIDSSQIDKMMNRLLNLFLVLLDSEDPDIHAVVCEGFCKLLMTRRVNSTKIVSRLIIMWYNPITEDNDNLRIILGVFFEVFSTSSQNQKLVEDAFIPTLNIIFDAPRASPIFQIDPLNVAKFMIELLRFIGDDKEKDKCFHDSLAIKICNEMLSDPYSIKIEVLTKLLRFLKLSNNGDTLKDLDTLCLELCEVIDEKNQKLQISRFHDRVKLFQNGSSDTNEQVPESADEIEDSEEEN